MDFFILIVEYDEHAYIPIVDFAINNVNYDNQNRNKQMHALNYNNL